MQRAREELNAALEHLVWVEATYRRSKLPIQTFWVGSQARDAAKIIRRALDWLDTQKEETCKES